MLVFLPPAILIPGNLYLAQYSGCDSVGLPEETGLLFKNLSWYNLNNNELELTINQPISYRKFLPSVIEMNPGA
jgi:hypothetical protein